MRDTFIIDPEFSRICPPLTGTEFAELERDILAHGIRDNSVVWKEKNILLDGHHRNQIRQKHNLMYPRIYLSFPNREAAKTWVMKSALARRNLTPNQIAEWRGQLYGAMCKDSAENLKQNASVRQSDASAAAAVGPTRETTAEELARLSGVSPRTVQRDHEYSQNLKKIEQAVGPEAKTAITTDEVKLTRDEVRSLAESGADAAKTWEKLTEERTRKLGAKTVARRSSPKPRPDCAGRIADMGERLCTAIDGYMAAGISAADRSRLASLWALRDKIDALAKEMSAPANSSEHV